jgi:hypothetical protein
MPHCYIRHTYVGNNVSFHFANHNHPRNLVGGFGFCDTIYYISPLTRRFAGKVPFEKYERSLLI